LLSPFKLQEPLEKYKTGTKVENKQKNLNWDKTCCIKNNQKQETHIYAHQGLSSCTLYITISITAQKHKCKK